MAKRKKKPTGQPPVIADNVEIVEFVNPGKKKIPKSESHRPKREQKVFDPSKFDFAKARHDVFQFGVSGLEEKEKLDAAITHAIKLGAKPPKNKYINYKILMAQKRKEKEEERLNRTHGGGDRFHLKPLVPKKSIAKKRDTNDVGAVNSLPGKVKDGVHVVKKMKSQ